MPKNKIPFRIPLLFLLVVAAAGCTTPRSSNRDTLTNAVIAVHKAAVPAARKMVSDAKAAVAAPAGQLIAAPSLADAREQVQAMETAVARYESIISAEDWQQRLVPLLRDALRAYQHLIQLGFGLPPVPPVVLDLLQPCGDAAAAAVPFPKEASMPQYQKKPIVITATQFFPDMKTYPEGVLFDMQRHPDGEEKPTNFRIETLEGVHKVSPGDVVITGVKGERYPCKPDIFAATYSPIDPADEIWVPGGDS